MRTRTLLTAIVALAAFAPAAGATSSSKLPTVLTQHARSEFAVKPATIDFTGDSTGTIGGADGTSPWKHPGHLKWTTYNNREGIATGLVWLNACEPSCAGGTFHSYAVRIHVSQPRSGHFTHLTLQYTYKNKPVTDRRIAAKHGSYWAYDILS